MWIFKEHVFHLKYKKKMIDAQWEPPRDTAIHPNENTNKKILRSNFKELV